MPFIVISPWVTKQGYISQNLRSQGAILNFIEDAFDLPTNALKGDTSGNSNVAVGSGALFSNLTTNYNVAVGTLSLNSNTGFSNTAVGYSALTLNIANQNVAVGAYSLDANVSGSAIESFTNKRCKNSPTIELCGGLICSARSKN